MGNLVEDFALDLLLPGASETVHCESDDEAVDDVLLPVALTKDDRNRAFALFNSSSMVMQD